MNEPSYVDTHVHVQMAEFDDDRKDVLRRYRDSGIQWVVCPGVDVSTSDLAAQLAHEEPDVFAAVGVHPEDCADAPSDYLLQLGSLAARYGREVVAIGEIGLDFKEGAPDHGLQVRFFQEQLQLAADLRLPVIVHSRFAVAESLSAISHFPGLHGVMHCFGGTPADVERAVSMDLCVSFTGNITYPGAHGTRAALQACPVERLLLETDAPYMPPIPMRGKRNEPSFIVHTYRAAALLLDRDLLELSRCIEQTARELFRQKERRQHAGEENVQDHTQP
ncbi:MAG: TatD family hydrolase [Caldiserica bacterium]|nr:TatD family hydrolase [Caldisericota bacterium]